HNGAGYCGGGDRVLWSRTQLSRRARGEPPRSDWPSWAVHRWNSEKRRYWRNKATRSRCNAQRDWWAGWFCWPRLYLLPRNRHDSQPNTCADCSVVGKWHRRLWGILRFKPEFNPRGESNRSWHTT